MKVKIFTKNWVSWCLLTSLLAIFFAGANAQPTANQARGFSAESYLSSDFDNVNLYNGNLTLTVPIGPTYTVGSTLKYNLTLVYNSNAWNYRTEWENHQNGNGLHTWVEPNVKSNAGHGWQLSLGALYPRNTGFYNTHLNEYLYVAPDGSEHLFYNNHTWDGSYLRLNETQRSVEFPDGTIHYFNPSTFQLSRMEDKFGNKVEVNTNDPSQWVISERCNTCPSTQPPTRRHYINFVSFENRWRVSSADLTAFNNTKATYNFDYGATYETIRRGPKDDNWTSSPTVKVWLLRGVELPANAGWYRFSYDTSFYNSEGIISDATLPTGGHYRWDWQIYYIPAAKPRNPDEVCNPYCPEDFLDPVNTSVGVYHKKIYKSAADAEANLNLIGTYEHHVYQGKTPTHSDAKGYFVVIVKSPVGDETVNYFNLDFNDGDHFPGPYFGLPFRSDSSINAGGKTLYLSQEFYKGSRTNGELVRSVYNKYETDGTLEGGIQKNPRVAAKRTAYHGDDEGRFADVFNSDWNTTGKFRRTKTSGNFESGNERETYTNYAGTVPQSGSPWILNLYTEQSVSETDQNSNTQYSHTQYCFDQTKGVLLKKRTLKNGGLNPSPSVEDIFVTYARDDGNGNVTSESYFGGDKSRNAPLGEICGATGVNPEYSLIHTYSYGVLESSKYDGLSASDQFFTVNNEIDKSTSLVRKSTDSSGLTTEYEYDGLGRITKTKPIDDAHTEYIYTPATSIAGAQVQIDQTRVSQTVGKILLERSFIKADPFGRVIEEHDPVPDNGGAATMRKFEYNAMGWNISVSEYGSATQKTAFSNFDPFGRAGWITAPDSKVTKLDYQGESKIIKSRDLATAVSGGTVTESTVDVIESYDRQGRLISVEEGAGVNNSRMTTEYKYDVGNRLKQVEQLFGTASAERVNWARSSNGGNAVASSTLNNNFLTAGANNGDRKGTNWGNNGGWHDATGASFPDQLWVDFNAPRRIDEVNVFTCQDTFNSPQEPTLSTTFSQYGIVDFDIHYLNSNNQFVLLEQIKGNNKVWRQVKFPPVVTTKIMVTVYRGLTNHSRITELEAIGTVVHNEDKQTRTFNYDNRGFLLSETHPEITGNVTYKYDSSGKVTEKNEGGSKLKYSYDKAGRITGVSDGNLNRALKSYAYYGTGVLNSLSKLRKATRHNWVINPYTQTPNSTEIEVKISEEYYYSTAGQGGRLGARKTTFVDGGTNPHVFQQTFDYDELGNLTEQKYPECQNATCVNSGMATPRTVKYGYESSYLKNVGWEGSPNGYGTLTYHSNKTINTVAHTNGVTDTYTKDLNNMQRIRKITFAKSGTSPWSWTSNDYQYDGGGNIKKIGSDWFIYDHANRVKEGTAGVDAQGRRYIQSYQYDETGNMTRRTTTKNGTTENFDMTIDRLTNRLYGVDYDAAGNVRGFGRNDVYVYDPLNMIKKVPGKTYLYGPTDERVWVVDKGYDDLLAPPTTLPAIVETITLRGLGNEVLREYQLTGGNAVGNWLWTKDYIYRGSTLLAAETRDSGKIDYHPDHLGSARFVTNWQGQQIESMTYFPYGMEAQGNSTERLRFTGHELDNMRGGPASTLYYMHARFYARDQAKFLSVDPGRDFDLNEPQSWNRYAYVRGNPVNGADPTGRNRVISTPDGSQQAFRLTSADNPTDGEKTDEEFNAMWEREQQDWTSTSAQSQWGGPLFVSILQNVSGGPLKTAVWKTFLNMVGLPASGTKVDTTIHISKYRRLKLKQGPPPPGMKDPQVHHEMPQTFRPWFQSKGIDIDNPNFTRYVDGSVHQKWSRSFNNDWGTFKQNNPNASPTQIFQFMHQMRNDPRFPSQ